VTHGDPPLPPPKESHWLDRAAIALILIGSGLQLLFLVLTLLAFIGVLIIGILLFGPGIGVMGFALFVTEFRYPIWRRRRWW
jgi:hypothetical protein